MNEGNTTPTNAMGLSDWTSVIKSTPVDFNAKPITKVLNNKNSNDVSTSQQPNAFHEAVRFLVDRHRSFGSSLASDEVKKLVDTFTNKIIQIYTKSASESKQSLLRIADFSCPICFVVVNEPLTVRCGHSYCKKCLQKETTGNQCRLCSYRFNNGDITELRPNVLLMSIADKLWPNNKKTADLRSEGNKLFQQQNQVEAILKYSEAIDSNSGDHLSLCNRAHIYLSLGNYSKALEDAESAINICPFWFKSYFRKAAILENLGQYEESFYTLTLCTYLIKITKTPDENAIGFVKNEMVKVLQRVLQTSSNASSQLSQRLRSTDIPQFSPYPHHTKEKKGDRIRNSQTWTETDCHSSEEEHEEDAWAGKTLLKSTHTVKEFMHNHHGANRVSTNPQDPLLIQLHRIFARSLQEVNGFEKRTPNNHLTIEEALASSSDFECSLCYRLLYQPVTTSCGHTYCRSCLERCLDHSPACPLCKTSLESCVAYRRHAITFALDQFICKFLPKEHEERVNQHLEELADGNTSGKSKELEIPIFVCTMAFPTVPCMLHVFEPRYRLMIRRCMESGSKRFGMCCYLQEGDHNYGDFGTMLEVRNIQYFPDGRSVCNTVGLRRFKVLKKSIKDGYNIASIEFLKDKPVEDTETSKVEETHETVLKDANEWLQSISPVIRQRIITHFGNMPSPEEDWMNVSDGPSWTWWLLAILPLDAKAQLAILGMNSLQKRLDSLLKVLRYVKTKLV